MINPMLANLIKPFVASKKPITFEVEPKDAKIKFSYKDNNKIIIKEGLITEYLKQITDFLNK